jgi:D-galactarolactone cycloisomerase
MKCAALKKEVSVNRFKVASARANPLKVQSVEAFPVSIKANESLRGGTFSYTHFTTVVVRAVVDDEEGWGEAMTRSDPTATAILVRYLAKRIIGEDLAGVNDAWQKVWRELRVRGHTRGVDVEALSGIEIALWDALGKIERKPLNRILAAKPGSSVPVFAGSLFSSRGPLEGQVELARKRGLSGAKVKIGFGVTEDRRTLRKVRRLWDEALIVADANGAYDASGAKKACAAFADLDLGWFEEPVLSDDIGGYRSLKGLGAKIGAGESWFGGDFDEPLRDRLVDVLEPSVSRCGGVGVEVEVARRAARAGMAFSPMTGMNSAISLAASIHVASAVGSVGVEFNPFPNPLQTDLATGLAYPNRGKVEVPRRDGLGIEIDEQFIKANAV